MRRWGFEPDLIVVIPPSTRAAGEPVVLDGVPFHTPMLPSDLAAPLSSTLGLPTLTSRGRTTSEALGLTTLASPDHYTFGAPRVSDTAAPFSKMLGLPLLVRSRDAGDAAR